MNDGLLKCDFSWIISNILQIRGSLNSNIQQNIYYDLFDYNTISRIVDPLFEQQPAVQSLDLAFSDSL
jgi:hypothetical protein